MGKQTCSICGEREDNVLMSLTDPPYDSVYLCLPCLPFYVQGMFEASGLPRFEIDFPELEAAEAAAGGVEVPAASVGTVRALDGDPPDGEAPDEDPDEATPEGPGLLEMVERAEGPRAVRPAGYRKPKSGQSDRQADEGFQEAEPSATHGHR